MRKIKYIAIHCTATEQSTKVSSILNYWKNRLNWKNPGYHFIIESNGNIEQLQPITKASNGVRGWNGETINVSYIGGKILDDRTPEQQIAMRSLLVGLKSMFPGATIKGHRDFPNVSKSCPRFDAEKVFADLNTKTQ